MSIRGATAKAAGAGLVLAGTGVVCAGAIAAYAIATWRKPSRDLVGKVVLITGGSRGLGLAMSEEFGRRGAKLALAARDARELERARALLVKRGAAKKREDVFIYPCDLRQFEEAERLVQKTMAHFGELDFLVNNAGIITVGPVENQSVEDFRDVMDTNFFAGLHCTLAALPQMLAQGRGNIVNITSIGGKIAVPHMLPYTASKFAAVGLSEGLYAELRSKGIRVTTVCPGLMRTGSHLNASFSGDAEREYRWFSLSAGLPGISTSARCAAKKIVRAAIAGRSEIAITPQAILATRLADVSPEITLRAMERVARSLPAPATGEVTKQRGSEVRGREVKPAMALAHAAARHYNQTGH
ncbi:MAG TPA: SDR family NAD(P)-dependent oxidoreductase [Acidobacteriaceae bacterium]|nr:SDR family NAD(P)-dependent oxidoreductase [Acidobacteriaceae bacterium]